MPDEPGAHGAVAQPYREAAIAQIGVMLAHADAMDHLMRTQPGDDVALDFYAERFRLTALAAGSAIQMFRQTRECLGVS